MARDNHHITHSPILWLEGRWSGNPNFVSLLRKKGFFIDTVTTGKSALDKLAEEEFDLVVVNAASMRTSGARICSSLKEKNPELPIILICDPDHNTELLKDMVNSLLVLPFTTRKLVNRIMPLLPGDEKNIIREVNIPPRAIPRGNGWALEGRERVMIRKTTNRPATSKENSASRL